MFMSRPVEHKHDKEFNPPPTRTIPTNRVGKEGVGVGVILKRGGSVVEEVERMDREYVERMSRED